MNVHDISMNCQLTEFVGTAVLDSIGLVIGGVDEQLHKAIGIPEHYHALGIFRSRTGAAGQITAVGFLCGSPAIDFHGQLSGHSGNPLSLEDFFRLC